MSILHKEWLNIELLIEVKQIKQKKITFRHKGTQRILSFEIDKTSQRILSIQNEKAEAGIQARGGM